MAGRRSSGRPWPRLRVVLAALFLATQANAQETAPVPLATVLILDQDRFFLESDFGKAAVERERTATAALEQENKRIEADLIAEEQALTDERKTLPAAEFAAKAEAFDQKVERIRSEQDAKSRQLTEARDKDRKAFLQAAVPVLGDLLGQKQAMVILDKNLVIVSLSAIDVTDEAIALVNAALAKDPAPAP
ncbi:MAG: OmpH family outer membrane protein [Rhodobacterales bacterium]|nr:OmpH family outer membrane protein [Rhodobacterales bacterium]